MKLSKLPTWTTLLTKLENGSKGCDKIEVLEAERGRMVNDERSPGAMEATLRSLKAVTESS